MSDGQLPAFNVSESFVFFFSVLLYLNASTNTQISCADHINCARQKIPFNLIWFTSDSMTELKLTDVLISQEDGLRQVLQEMEALFEQNQTDV